MDLCQLIIIKLMLNLKKFNLLMLYNNWGHIDNYDGLYEISDNGEVKSLEKTIQINEGNRKVVMKRKERILKWGFTLDGYPQVKLSKGNKMKTFRVHILVWEAFGNTPRNGHKVQVDHIDGNKNNANISNLRLLSNRENTIQSKLRHKKKRVANRCSFL